MSTGGQGRQALPDLSTPDGQKSHALSLLLDAWQRALDDGIEPEILATTAIFAALTDMVDLHGVEAVAQMCAQLPERVMAGEFSFELDGIDPPAP